MEECGGILKKIRIARADFFGRHLIFMVAPDFDGRRGLERMGDKRRNRICVSILDLVSTLSIFPGFFVRRSQTEVSTLPVAGERLKEIPAVFVRRSCQCGIRNAE